MSYLHLEGIDKHYGQFHAIKDISLSIEKGEFVVFVGPSGCGKSTLLRIIAGLEDISGGSITLEDRKITKLAPSKRDLAMVFQTYALYPHMTVEGNMSFALKTQKKDPALIAEKVARAAEKLNLTEYLKRTPKELSGGQRQRVAIGRAIVRSPKVFLFDEPLSNLDAALRVQTRVEIAQLHRELGATSIYVTHDQVEAMTLADRVVVLRAGVIEQVGTPMQLYDAPANKFVAQFIGMPQMNIMPIEHFPHAPQGASEVGIRPEHLRITDGAGIRARVSMIESLGNETLIYCALSEHKQTEQTPAEHGQAILRLNERVNLQYGEQVHLTPDLDKAHYFDAAGRIIKNTA